MTHEKDDGKAPGAGASEVAKIATQGAALLAIAGPKAAGAYLAYEGTSTLVGRSIGPYIARRFNEAMRGISRRLGRDPDAAAPEGPTAPEEEIDVLALVFRSLLESPDEAAVPALEALAADYIANGRKADTFMRKTARMLVDLSSDDLVSVRDTLRMAQKHEEEGPRLAIVAEWDKEALVTIRPYKTGFPGKHPHGVANGLRAVEILAGSQIGRHLDVNGGVALVLDIKTIGRLVAILGSASLGPGPCSDPPAP